MSELNGTTTAGLRNAGVLITRSRTVVEDDPPEATDDDWMSNDWIDEHLAWEEEQEAAEAAARARHDAWWHDQSRITDQEDEELEDPPHEADREDEAAPEARDDHMSPGELAEADYPDPAQLLVEPELDPVGVLIDGGQAEVASEPPGRSSDAEPDAISDEAADDVESAGRELTMIKWSRDWSLAHAPVRFLAEPLLEEGRSVALVAPAKAGKSLLVLEVAAGIATGRPVLMMDAKRPARRVLYLDYENSPSDILKRLLDMGYDESELDNLMYASFPNLPPLGSPAGAQALLAEVDRRLPDLVVIDTLVRAVDGDENDSRTITDFYRHTLLPLKRRGVAVLRLDHAGRNAAHGARGSSAKNDDVDAVWRLQSVGDNDLLLSCTHARSQVSFRQVALRRERGPLRHRVLTGPEEALVRQGTEVSATEAMKALLDEVGVPRDAGRPTAERMLSEAGHGFQKKVLEDAIRERKAAGHAPTPDDCPAPLP